MTSTHDLTRSPSPAPSRTRRFTAWPLWASVAGIAGAAATVGTDLRPAAEMEAAEQGRDHLVTSADMIGLDPVLGRIGFTIGILAVTALLVFAASWRRHIETRYPRSTAARLVSIGLVATAGALFLGYGWRGSLANYLGPEAGMYGPEGLFVYYVLTDFGAYLPWIGVTISAFGLAWMAWAERQVSRVLGTVTAVFAVGTIGAVLVSGVPGLPGVLMPVWLTITGIWLAVGRRTVNEAD